MGFLAGIAVKAVLAMVGKIVTAEFIQFTILKMGEILVKRTDTPHDDEFLAKMKELLDRK